MNNKTTSIRTSFNFFKNMQSQNKHFSRQEISNATGWGKSTVSTYLSKKWPDIIFKCNDGLYAANISSYTEDAYVHMMSQNYKKSIQPFKPVLPAKVESLVYKARSFAILAIDIYNRPLTPFRSYGYIVMMNIAWTALFHAIFENTGVDYFYKDKTGKYKLIDGDKKAWELETCLNHVNTLLSPAEVANLKLFIGLRNKIVHRYVPEIDLYIIGECQALLFNFEDLITKKFSIFYALNNSLSIPLQITKALNDAQINALKNFQSTNYKELKNYIDTYRDSLSDTIGQDNKYRFRVFLVPKIGNHPSSSDLDLEFINENSLNKSELAKVSKNVALIRDKIVPVSNPGKYKPKAICEILSTKLKKPISIYIHTNAWKYYNVRKSGLQPTGCNTLFCQYDEAHGDYIYTQEWIDFLANKFSNNDEFDRVKRYNCKRKD